VSARVFRNANTIVYGRGSLAHLKTLKSRRALVLTSQSALEKSGVLAETVALLEGAGAHVEVVRGTKPEPPIEDVEAQLETVVAFQPDALVALGGGSVIDSAKALWAFYEHPELDHREIFKAHVSQPYPLPKLGRQARLVAIPSTSGTGSETSGVSILVETDTRVKRVLLSSELVPTLAICDPEIVFPMPAQLAAHTGMDALTHALESVISPWSTDFSEPLALRALQLIFQDLRAACDGDRTARERMHYAATLAGMAINNSITGLAHGMDKIGLHFGLPHGLTCAVLLPYTLQFSASQSRAGCAKIARHLGLPGESEEALAAALLRSLAQLEKDIGIPRSFRELGIEASQFEEKIELVREYVLKAGPTVFSPRVPSPEELRELYRQAFRGQPAG
jgi:alcohol dehydrogenase class IV